MKGSYNFVFVGVKAIIFYLLIFFQVAHCSMNSERKRKLSPLPSSSLESSSGFSTASASSDLKPAKIQRRIFFWNPTLTTRPPIDYEANPPRLFTCCNSASSRSKLPENISYFIVIFAEYHDAHRNDFEPSWKSLYDKCKQGHVGDYELSKWERSDVVNAVSQRVHYDFIIQFINSFIGFDLPLLKEYIDYFMSRFTLSDHDYFKLLVAAIERLESSCIAALLKYLPSSGFPSNLVISLWNQISTYFAKYGVFDCNLRYDNPYFLKKFEIWKIIRLFTKHFGLINRADLGSLYHYQGQLDMLISIHPIFLGFTLFDPSLIAGSALDVHRIDSKFLIAAANAIIYMSWNEIMQSVARDRIEIFADAFFKLFFDLKFTLWMILKMKHALNLAEFLICYSKEARASLSNEKIIELLHDFIAKEDNFFEHSQLLLSRYDNINLKDLEAKFAGSCNFDRYKLILRTVESFHIKSNDGNLISIFKSFTETETAKYEEKDIFDEEADYGNRFIVEWTPPPIEILNEGAEVDDLENSFLYDAGRIILSRHFGIPFAFTYYSVFEEEQCCFRDLAWLIEFHVNFRLRKYKKYLKICINDAN